jgi:hypothetical protein
VSPESLAEHEPVVVPGGVGEVVEAEIQVVRLTDSSIAVACVANGMFATRRVAPATRRRLSLSERPNLFIERQLLGSDHLEAPLPPT